MNTRSEVMTTKQQSESVFFDEGDGYYYIKALGSGADGNVTLVSTGPDGQFLARKEALRTRPITKKSNQWYLEPVGPLKPNHTDEDATGEDLSKPSKEVCIAQQLSSVSGVCNVLGWCRQIDPVNKEVVSSSYWAYYNGGSLKKLFKNEQPLAEYWVSRILLSMAETLTQIHRLGIIHRDCHEENWFWEHIGNPNGDHIRVVLGDFARARSKEEVNHESWNENCWLDYAFLIEIALRLLDLPENLVGDGKEVPIVPHSQDYHCSKAFWVLLHDLKTLSVRSDGDPVNEVERWIVKLRQHHGDLKPSQWPCPVEEPVEWFTKLDKAIDFIRDKPGRLKYWQVAEFSDDRDAPYLLHKMPDEFLAGPQFMFTCIQNEDFDLN